MMIQPLEFVCPTSAPVWEAILNAKERDDAKRDSHIVQEKQVEINPTPQQANEATAAPLHEIIAEKVERNVANAQMHSWIP